MDGSTVLILWLALVVASIVFAFVLDEVTGHCEYCSQKEKEIRSKYNF